MADELEAVTAGLVAHAIDGAKGEPAAGSADARAVDNVRAGSARVLF